MLILYFTSIQVGAIDEIERLQEHDNEDVYKAALTIIDTWFKDELEGRDLEFYFFVNRILLYLN